MTLKDFFQTNNSAAIAFSGGVDSAYLVYAALKYKADICAYLVKTEFQPTFELSDAERLASELNFKLKILNASVLDCPEIACNSNMRCYYCKKKIFTTIMTAAKSDGYTLLLDGTNASDMAADRPGMRALSELSVRSPLRECNLSKPEIRSLSKTANLFNWNKAAYACLATRINCGESITVEKLKIIEKSEDFLTSLGFSDFRLRTSSGTAKLQVRENQLENVLQKKDEIVAELRKYFSAITLDLEVRKQNGY